MLSMKGFTDAAKDAWRKYLGLSAGKRYAIAGGLVAVISIILGLSIGLGKKSQGSYWGFLSKDHTQGIDYYYPSQGADAKHHRYLGANAEYDILSNRGPQGANAEIDILKNRGPQGANAEIDIMSNRGPLGDAALGLEIGSIKEIYGEKYDNTPKPDVPDTRVAAPVHWGPMDDDKQSLQATYGPAYVPKPAAVSDYATVPN